MPAVAVAAVLAGFAPAGVAGAARLGPRLVLAPVSGPPGTSVSVRGSGFRPWASGTVVFGARRVASFRVTRRGRLLVRFVVPAGAGGRVRVVVRQLARGHHGSIRRLSLAARFQVVPAGLNAPISEVGPAEGAGPGAPAGSAGGPGGSDGSGGPTGGVGVSPGSTGGSGSGATGSGGSEGGSSDGSGGSEGGTGGSEGGSVGGSTGSGGSEGGSGGLEGGSGGGSSGGTGGSEGGSGGGSIGPEGGLSEGGSSGGFGVGSTGGWWVPPQHLTWYWQLQGTVDNSEPVEAYDVDGFESTAAEVAALHAQGKHVICYIDVGTAENWRPDYSSFPASVLGGANGWPGENWLDIRQLSVLEPIMTARFQMCREKGFDAVEPDNMDGYENNTGFSLTADDQLTYDEWVAGEVHALGMAVFQKNDGERNQRARAAFRRGARRAVQLLY